MHAVKVLQALKNNKDVCPDRLAIEGETIFISYFDLYESILAASDFFQEKHIKQGDTVALCINDSVSHLIASLALLKLGACEVALPRDFYQSGSETSRLDVSFIIERKEDVEVGLAKPLCFRESLEQVYVIKPVTKNNPVPETAGHLKRCMLIMGSGTTGQPKVISVSAESLDEQIARDMLAMDFLPQDKIMLLTPVSYFTSKRRIFGCWNLGGTLVLRPQTENLIEYCQRKQVDHLTMVISHAVKFRALGNMNITKPLLPDLKSLFIGASPISENIRAMLRAYLSPNTYIFYGPNEIGPCLFGRLDNNSPEGTLGRVVSGIKMEIIDVHGLPCKPGETGELRFQCASLICSYFDAAIEQQNNTFRNGWFYPGDLACLQDDGQVIFKGRKDDMVIYQGVNIYPREIEEQIEKHANVAECAAFGIETYRFSEVPVAVYVPRNIATTNESNEELVLSCKANLRFKAPWLILAVDTLPKNQAGKVLKRQLREELHQRMINIIRRFPD